MSNGTKKKPTVLTKQLDQILFALFVIYHRNNHSFCELLYFL